MEPQILATWAQIGISSVGLTGIFWGLFQMQKAGRRRDRAIDRISQASERQGQVLAELSRRSA